MEDSNIQLLPDSLANQIAAGEVVQRPASVVKELLENAVDAKATRILLRVEDAGKRQLLVQDNGSGMGFHDARMCFERHATSKIRSTDDLFCINTLGFRGEALASIAAVAQVELKTRQANQQIGAVVVIEGGYIQKHEPAPTIEGSILSVRNLFFNVPARRNFLKSNATELKQVIIEFQRIALSYPNIHFVLEIDNQPAIDYFPTNLSGRICQVYSWIKETDLLRVTEEMPVVAVSGYVGIPAIARKTRGEQFLFVNGRFVKDYALHHAIVAAYRQTLPAESVPVYVLNLSLDPTKTDINIHPTKSEIKFDDERLVYNVVNSAVRKAIGQTLSLPEISDFQLKTAIEHSQKQIDTQPEDITIGNLLPSGRTPKPMLPSALLEKLYKPVQEVPEAATFFLHRSNLIFTALHASFWLLRQSEDLFLLNAAAARERVWYERYLQAFADGHVASQKLLYPQQLTLSPEQHVVLKELIPELAKAGFELVSYDKNSWIITALPFGLSFNQADYQLLSIITHTVVDPDARREHIALQLCRAHHLEKLSIEQVSNLWTELTRCQEQHVSPFGEVIQKKIYLKDIQSWF